MVWTGVGSKIQVFVVVINGWPYYIMMSLVSKNIVIEVCGKSIKYLPLIICLQLFKSCMWVSSINGQCYIATV